VIRKINERLPAQTLPEIKETKSSKIKNQ